MEPMFASQEGRDLMIPWAYRPWSSYQCFYCGSIGPITGDGAGGKLFTQAKVMSSQWGARFQECNQPKSIQGNLWFVSPSSGFLTRTKRACAS